MDNRGRVLQLLLGAEAPVTGTLIAGELGVSRAYVHRMVEELRGEGYVIEGRTRKGYVLTCAPDKIEPELLRSMLSGRLGRELDYGVELDSTNRRAVELALQGAGEGLVVVAETQANGRGRMGRKWLSPRGGLWFSVLLRPDVEPRRAGALPLLAGLATARALETFNLEPKLKWPNDVMLSGKKVGGILCETGSEPGRIEHVVVGVGINVNNAPPLDGSTSIIAETGETLDRANLLAGVLGMLEEEYVNWMDDQKAFLEPWRRRSNTLGHMVRVEAAEEGRVKIVEGKAVDIKSNGALLVETEGEISEVLWGDCIHLK